MMTIKNKLNEFGWLNRPGRSRFYFFKDFGPNSIDCIVMVVGNLLSEDSDLFVYCDRKNMSLTKEFGWVEGRGRSSCFKNILDVKEFIEIHMP